jgi:hypothetical protein
LVEVFRQAKRKFDHAAIMPPSCRYHGGMSRFRMYPTSEQAGIMLGHCAHARYV